MFLEDFIPVERTVRRNFRKETNAIANNDVVRVRPSTKRYVCKNTFGKAISRKSCVINIKAEERTSIKTTS